MLVYTALCVGVSFFLGALVFWRALNFGEGGVEVMDEWYEKFIAYSFCRVKGRG